MMFNETMFRLKVNMMCGVGAGGGGPGGEAGDPGAGGEGGSGGNVGGGVGPGGGIGNSGLGVSTAGELGAADAGMGPGSPGAPGPGIGPGMEGFEGAQGQFGGNQGMEAEANLGNDSGFMGSEESIAQAFSDADISDAIGQAVAQAETEPTAIAKAVSLLTSVAKTGLSLVISDFGVSLLSAALNSFGMNQASVTAAIEGMQSGMNPSDIGASLSGADFGGNGGPADPPDGYSATGVGDTTGGGGTGGGGGGSVANNDPLSYDFWNNFVDEWMGKNGKSAKTMYGEDDAFKKSKVEPAIGKYQAALADLTNQAQTGTGTFTPTTFGMGDFRSSFVPKSGHLMADKLKDYAKEGLTSELALTDVMQPNKGSMDYLTALQALAQFDREADIRKYGIDMGYNTAIDSIQEGQEDKGSWLDVISDVVKIGDQVGDAWSKYF